ncbi:MAG: NfeD family protein [Clostridiales Family XIII bacterium]|nr:NfeD family protein [Clostridiales Family XIII bacterium]
MIEGVTLGFVTIWFTIGALIASVIAMAGGNPLLQCAVFVVVSIVLLIFTRPILVKHLKVGREKNVTEQIEGKLGLVTEAIAPFDSGLVKVGGIIWTAVGESPDFTAESGAEVRVRRVEGVKLIVEHSE